MPPTSAQQQHRPPPKTAIGKFRSNKQQRKHNSLNLHVPIAHGSQRRIKAVEVHNQNLLLGRIEPNKYMTEKDHEVEVTKLDELKRQQWLEQQNYNLF